MKRLLLLLILLIPLTVTASDMSPEEIFHNANHALDEGQYDQAAEGYQSLLAMGIENGSIHANLAQALFREGKLGEAVFHYVMATKLKPRNPDLETNLSYLRARTADKIEARPQSLVMRLLHNVSTKMNAKENWIGFLSLWLLFWSVAAARLFWKRDLLRWSSWILGASLFLMTTALVQKEFLERPAGVVIASTAKVYSGPGEENVSLFELHEGAEFSVLRGAESGWVAVELADGKKGWIRRSDLLSQK